MEFTRCICASVGNIESVDTGNAGKIFDERRIEFAETANSTAQRIMPEKPEAKKKRKPGGRPFPKGVSGNPGGRPKTDPEVKAILKAAAPDAARRLVEMMYSDNEKIAMWAITDILDRTQGKAIQEQTVNMDVTGFLDVGTQVRSILLEREREREKLKIHVQSLGGEPLPEPLEGKMQELEGHVQDAIEVAGTEIINGNV